MMKSLVILSFICSVLLAKDIEVDFLKSLDEVSEIATKTKLNIDDTPSFITVLRSKKLKELGAKNILEALRFVPGIEVKRELSGVPVIIFRGVTQKSEVKLMVDGVTINNSYRGSIYYYLDFPIDMIDRIEVIRGAGSIMYGSNAISGVINIITKTSQESTKNSVFVSAGSYDYTNIGAVLSTKLEGVKIGLDVYRQKDNKKIDIDEPQDSDRHLDDFSVGINIAGENLSFNSRIKKSNAGNAYGILGTADTQQDKFFNENTNIFAQLEYKDKITLNNELKVLAGYTRYNQKVQTQYITHVITTDYLEENYFGEIMLSNKSLKNNRFFIGAKIDSAKELKNDWQTDGKDTKNLVVDSGLHRDTISLYLNDEYSLGENTNLSAGLRYDYFSDFKGSISPNLGIVYKLNEDIRLKALYSHAFRAPSWIEVTSNDDLVSEKSDTLEAGIIFKPSSQNILRLNAYAMILDDMIVKKRITEYDQDGKNSFYGSELQYTYAPNNNIQIDFIASYVDARDKDNNRLPDVANGLAGCDFIYETDSGFVFGSTLRYVSSSARVDGDTRDNMDESWIFNQTITYNYKDFSASLVLNDLFDANTNYSAAPRDSKAIDFDDGGRNMMLNLSLEF